MLKLVSINPDPISASELQEITDDPNSIFGIPPKKRSFREEVIAGILPHFVAKAQLMGLSSYTMIAVMFPITYLARSPLKFRLPMMSRRSGTLSAISPSSKKNTLQHWCGKTNCWLT